MTDDAAPVGGVHAVYPLEPAQVGLLYDLLRLRSALTILLYDFHTRHGRDRGAELGTWIRTFRKSGAVDSSEFTGAVRAARGFQRRRK